MNTDIRLSLEFLDHPKIGRIHRRCGPDGVISLLRLWLWTAANRSNGKLDGLDADDIEWSARWPGESGVFISTIVSAGLLDVCEDGSYEIHDWKEHNTWAASDSDRSGASRLLKLSQVNKSAWKECKRRGIDRLSSEEYEEWKTYTPLKQHANSDRNAIASDTLAERSENHCDALAPNTKYQIPP